MTRWVLLPLPFLFYFGCFFRLSLQNYYIKSTCCAGLFCAISQNMLNEPWQNFKGRFFIFPRSNGLGFSQRWEGKFCFQQIGDSMFSGIPAKNTRLWWKTFLSKAIIFPSFLHRIKLHFIMGGWVNRLQIHFPKSPISTIL